jgi:hypothetical protein
MTQLPVAIGNFSVGLKQLKYSLDRFLKYVVLKNDRLAGCHIHSGNFFKSKAACGTFSDNEPPSPHKNDPLNAPIFTESSPLLGCRQREQALDILLVLCCWSFLLLCATQGSVGLCHRTDRERKRRLGV